MTVPPPYDLELLRRAWAPLTIRVGWELTRRSRLKIKPPTLEAAREHALWRMQGARSVAEVEARVPRAVEEYLARKKGRFAPVEDEKDVAADYPLALRTNMREDIELEQDVIFRLHYADGHSLSSIAELTKLDMVTLRVAREGLRELGRWVLCGEGIDATGWDPARIDHAVRRIANLAAEPCPAPTLLGTEAGRFHADGCPRCGRALRLVRDGVLSLRDLAPPEESVLGGTGEDPLARTGTVDLACIFLHPDARSHAVSLYRSLGTGARLAPAGDEILVHVPTCGHLQQVLDEAARHSCPPASQIRVVRREVSGGWSRGTILGPGIVGLRAAAGRSRWGEVHGLTPLPEPLPRPPSAARWWTGAVVAGLVALLATLVVRDAPAPPGDVELIAEARPGRVRFDTDDLASVWVVAVHAEGGHIVFDGHDPLAKADITDGNGAYVVEGAPRAWIVVASSVPLDVEKLLAAGPVGESAEDMTERLRTRYNAAAVHLLRAVPPAAAPVSAEGGAEVPGAELPDPPTEAAVPAPVAGAAPVTP